MFRNSYSSAIYGMEVCIIHVEVDISDGLPIFQLVGFLASEVKEAKERVRISIRNSGYKLPTKRITVNLSPADIHKEGTAFDLAIACGILSGLGVVREDGLKNVLLIGELGLNGKLCSVNGVLPMVYEARNQGFSHAVVPYENLSEASMVDGICVYGAKKLSEAAGVLNRIAEGETVFQQEKRETAVSDPKSEEKLDFQDVYGQELLKRAMEVAAAGMHNLLIFGPPGTGKSMLVKRLPGILPEPDFNESMEISKIYSIAGLLDRDHYFITERPIRSPHHSITEAALIGGGRYPKPGEISLASGGVLFLDELTEFPRKSIELLRQPLEDGFVTINRLSSSYRYPCHTMLVGAMNPCPCGFYPDRNRCSCSERQVKRYLEKLSNPFLERMDLSVEAVFVDYKKIRNGKNREAENYREMESSEMIRRRVEQAQRIQRGRFQNETISYNSEMEPKQIEQYCILDHDLEQYMEGIYRKYCLSTRGYHKILKVARTIADLEESEKLKKIHLEEALSYRMFQREVAEHG